MALLVPEDAAGTAVFGWLDVCGHRLPFRVVGLGDGMRSATLKPGDALGRLLAASRATVDSVMRQSRTVDAFIQELDAIVKRLLSAPGAAEVAGLGRSQSRPQESESHAPMVRLGSDAVKFLVQPAVQQGLYPSVRLLLSAA